MRGRKAARDPNWFGAIAQLGERLHGMQEVSGSIPLGSTNQSDTPFLCLRPFAISEGKFTARNAATDAKFLALSPEHSAFWGACLRYRPEIDGLRTIAVVPVVLFHAGWNWFSGGFVGVDVFFVISGYLITSLILADIDAGTFSIARFYERRARRILPALFVILVACVPLSLIFMMPKELEAFSETLASVLLFVSNFVLYFQSGYFDQEVAFKPLIHTWSLAVEEQFYIFFPLLLYALRRKSTRVTAATFGIVALVSFALAQLAGNFTLQPTLLAAKWSWSSHADWGFFMLPTRAWELLIGSLAAVLLVRRPDWQSTLSRAVSEAGSLLGLAMISAAIFIYDHHTPFPSVYALLPTIGAALVILFGRRDTLANALLSRPLMIGIGLISYSLYLWHQPLFAYARLATIGEPHPWVFAALIIASFGLAYVTWRYVEQPFRNRARVQLPTLLKSLAAAAVALFAAGIVGVKSHGLPQRLPDDVNKLMAFQYYDINQLYRHGRCFLKPEQTQAAFTAECDGASNGAILWGDSHAAALWPGLAAAWPGLSQFTASACPPMQSFEAALRPHCRAINDWVVDAIARSKPSFVVLHANWSIYMTASDRFELLASTLRHVKENVPAARLVVVGGAPQWESNFPKMLAYRAFAGETIKPGMFVPTAQIRSLRGIDARLREVASATGATFVSLLDMACQERACRAMYELHERSPEPATWDYGHMTKAASLAIGKRVADVLSEIAGHPR